MKHSTPNVLWLGQYSTFTLLPSLDLHPSHLPRLDPQGHWQHLLALSPEPAIVHRHWSHDILHQLQLEPSISPCLPNPPLQLALLDRHTLEQLCAWLGLQLCQQRIKQFIQAQDIQRLLNGAHAQYVQQARLEHSDLAYLPAQTWDAEKVEDFYQPLGRAALLHACHDGGAGLIERLRLKLPHTEPWAGLPDPALIRATCLAHIES